MLCCRGLCYFCCSSQRNGESVKVFNQTSRPLCYSFWIKIRKYFKYLNDSLLRESFPDDSAVENPPANAGNRRLWSDPWAGKILWRRKWQSTPVFLPGKSHGWSLVGYSPWGRKESDTTERLHFSLIHAQGIIVHLEDNLWIASSEGWILSLFPSPLILCFKRVLRERIYLHYFAYPYYYKNERKKKYKKFVKSPYCSVAWFFW